MKILFGTRNDGPDAYFRALAPASVLVCQAYEVEARQPVLWDDAALFDVLILQRHASAAGYLIMQDFQRANKPVIYDTDDWLPGIPPSWPCYERFFLRGSGAPRESVEWFTRMVQMANMVTCPSPGLADNIACYNERVRIIPNCVMMADWDCLPPVGKEISGPLLGWFGSINHWDSWKEIAPVVDEALAAVDGHLAILGFPEVVHCFPARLAERTMVQPSVLWKSFHQMRRLIRSFDIGLAWLDDTHFNRNKSPLKLLQYGAAGVPVIASHAVYGEMWQREHQCVCQSQEGFMTTKFGLVAMNPEALYDAILYAVEHLEAMRSMARAWQQVVFYHHSYEMQSVRWLKLVREVLDR